MKHIEVIFLGLYEFQACQSIPFEVLFNLLSIYVWKIWSNYICLHRIQAGKDNINVALLLHHYTNDQYVHYCVADQNSQIALTYTFVQRLPLQAKNPGQDNVS